MSRDIRSFFPPKAQKKPKIEDDDVIPESPDVQIKNKKKESRKKRIVIDDSDEEIFTKKKKPDDSKDLKSSKNKSKSPQKPALKEVKVVDLFGKAPIKRTDPIVKKVKKESEVDVHNDDGFAECLDLADIEESFTEEIKKETSPVKENGINRHMPEKSKHESKKRDKDQETKKSDSVSKSHKEIKQNIKREEKHEKTEKDTNKSNGVPEIKQTENNENVVKNDKKRDFSEFIGNDESTHEEDLDTTIKSKKRKLNKSLNESVLSDEERHERKRLSAVLYQNYKNRAGPKHLGSKEIPEGSPDCLKDCAFLLTGVLDAFERDEVAAAITKYGGCVKNGISKKVTHVLAGEEAGPAKLAKAEELGIRIINEDQFLQMIVDLSNKKTSGKSDSKADIKKEKVSKSKESSKKSDKSESEHTKKQSSNNLSASVKREKSRSPVKNEINKATEVKKEESVPKIKKEADTAPKLNGVKEKHDTDVVKSPETSDNSDSTAMMWVEKYKPQNLKQIIGQHGDASNVKKLCNWLTKWYVNRKAKLPKPSPWAKNDDGGYYKAALLSGPPGVGKTTTVSLVCKELGFDMVEFNASDTRSKTLIKEQIGELLTTNSLSGFAKGDRGKQAVTKKHVLVMDEVDGMAGNEDRGGLQELISLIKSSSVPIICMCNDRNSQKMRSLVNYCYDLRFTRPKVPQIMGAMKSVCHKEGITIPGDALTQLIVAANQDVRQTLNLLSMWAIDPSRTDADTLKKDATSIKKDIKMGPWEAVRKVFTAEEHKSMSINDKSDLFFHDYSLAPLFVQENYLQVAPHCHKNEVLDRISRAADSISIGDLVDARIRGSQAWGLLPTQAMYSSVLPGHHMSGHVTGQIQFPGWLGKNSRRNKMHRLCQEIHAHTRLSTTGSKSSIFLDYSSHLRDAIVNPLIKDKADGITKSLEVLESYNLLREDLDSLTELSLWPGQRNPTVLIDSKVKAAMTRTYNKNAKALPYAPGAVKRGAARADDDLADPDEDNTQEDADDSDPENDALIKKKKVKEDKPGPSKEMATSSKSKKSKAK